MKLFGKEITKSQIGYTSLGGYLAGYALFYMSAALPSALTLIAGIIAGFAWTYLAAKEEKTFGFWLFVAFQMFIVYNVYLGFIGA